MLESKNKNTLFNHFLIIIIHLKNFSAKVIFFKEIKILSEIKIETINNLKLLYQMILAISFCFLN